MYPRGMIAMTSGLILLLGHFLTFLVVFSNSTISPSAKSDVIAIIIPLTVASLISAALYASKNAEINLKETPKANLFFALFAIVIPSMFFCMLLYGMFMLDGDESVKDFKTFTVIAEGVFGGVFAIMTEAIFGSQNTATSSEEGVSSE